MSVPQDEPQPDPKAKKRTLPQRSTRPTFHTRYPNYTVWKRNRIVWTSTTSTTAATGNSATTTTTTKTATTTTATTIVIAEAAAIGLMS